MIKLISLIIAGTLTLTGCSSDGSTSNTEETQVKVEKQEEEIATSVKSDDMVVDQEMITFKLDGIKVVKDYEGNDALEINYTFTNKQEDATSALVGVCTDGYQNGKEMEIAIVDRSEFKEQIDLKKGVSQDNCTNYLVLTDDSEVELEVYQTYSSAWSKDPAVFKINIKDGTVTRVK